MPNPYIQIGDEVREMTDEEAAEYRRLVADLHPLPAGIELPSE